MSVKFLLLLLLISTLIALTHGRDRNVFDYSKLVERANSFDFSLDTVNTSTILSSKNETKHYQSFYHYILNATHQIGQNRSLLTLIQYASFLPLVVNILIEIFIRLATRNKSIDFNT